MLDIMDDLFHTGGKYAEDERQRLEHTRVVEGSHGTGHGPIDLESGCTLIVPQPGGVDAVLPPKPRIEESETEEGEV